MPKHGLMIPLVVRRFYPTPNSDNKLESRFDANDCRDGEVTASYDLFSFNSDFLGDDKSMPKNESSNQDALGLHSVKTHHFLLFVVLLLLCFETK